MAKEQDGGYGEIELTPPTNGNKQLKQTVTAALDDNYDPNEDLVNEDVEQEVINRLNTAKQPPLRQADDGESDGLEEDDSLLDDMDDDESYDAVQPLKKKKAQAEEEEVASVEEEASEDEEGTTTDEGEAGSVKKKSRIPKRIESLTTKLKEQHQRYEQLEIEAAEREAQYTQALYEMNERLTNALQASANAEKMSASAEVEAALRKMKQAKANADEDAETDAMEALVEAKYRLKAAEAKLAEVPKMPDGYVRPQVNSRQVITERKNTRFVEANKQILGNPLVQNVLRAVDAKLQQEGFNPADDEYRTELTKRSNAALTKRGVGAKLVNPFDYTMDDDDSLVGYQGEDDTPPVKTKNVPAKKQVNPMSKGNPLPPRNRTVARLDDTDKHVIHKFGLKPEVYLKQRAVQNRVGKQEGYTPIYVPTRDNNSKK